MKIYFGSSQINNDYIMGLSQSAYLFDDTFKLGSTVCRQVILQVNKAGVVSQPTSVFIKDDNNNTLFTLQVDNVDDTNKIYYEYTLVDKMVNLNVEYDWGSLLDQSVQGIVDSICSDLLNSNNPPTVDYLDDLEVTWSQGISARDFISYVAEVNGSFARITAVGDLEFVEFTNSNPYSINVDDCADFALGEYHEIDRVVVDLGTATVKYPDDTSYTGTHNTCYINSDNILLTDSGSYSISATIQHIYGLINGFMFYSAGTNRCPINDAILPGDPIKYVDGLNEYLSIAQYDLNYNCMWTGGYNLSVETKKQEETKIVDAKKKYNSQINIIVDRQLGEIRQDISRVNQDLTSQVSTVRQTADGLSLQVSQVGSELTDLDNRLDSVETAVNITTDGVKISQGTQGSYTNITDSGMDIYVNDNKVAWATNKGFSATSYSLGDWNIEYTNNNETLNFFRRSS